MGTIDRPPRGLTRDAAATYCGLSPAGFDDWQQRGLVPGPMPGTKRWDIKAIDAALDKLSGLDEPLEEPKGAFGNVGKNAVRR